ncbi:Cysteine synthase [compost metagenome]
MLKAYGAEVVLTPAAMRMPGSIEKAKQLLEEIPDSFMPQQFLNTANPDIHRLSTGPEILSQMDHRLDMFIATAGTGGTITGTGEYLRDHIKDIQIIVVEPKGSPVLSGGQPGPHKLVGTSPGFIPSILNTDVYDEIIQVEDQDAIETVRKLASMEGILVGPSSGASVWTAIQYARKLGKGKRIVCIAPDTGERYLSMDGLFNIEK